MSTVKSWWSDIETDVLKNLFVTSSHQHIKRIPAIHISWEIENQRQKASSSTIQLVATCARSAAAASYRLQISCQEIRIENLKAIPSPESKENNPVLVHNTTNLNWVESWCNEFVTTEPELLTIIFFYNIQTIFFH